jgi:hypothetical protein
MSRHDRDAEIAAFIRTKGVTRCPTACVVPTQGSPDLADQRRSNSTQLPATNCCGRKSPLAGKFSAFCGFGIEPWCRSYNVLHSPATEIRHCKRDPGAPGIRPAVQNFAASGESARSGATLTTLYLRFRKPRPHSACRPVSIPMPCCRSATLWAGLSRFVVWLWPMSFTKIDGARLTAICSRRQTGRVLF